MRLIDCTTFADDLPRAHAGQSCHPDSAFVAAPCLQAEWTVQQRADYAHRTGGAVFLDIEPGAIHPDTPAWSAWQQGVVAGVVAAKSAQPAVPVYAYTAVDPTLLGDVARVLEAYTPQAYVPAPFADLASYLTYYTGLRAKVRAFRAMDPRKPVIPILNIGPLADLYTAPLYDAQQVGLMLDAVRASGADGVGWWGYRPYSKGPASDLAGNPWWTETLARLRR